MRFTSHQNQQNFAEAVAQPIAARLPMTVVGNTLALPYRCICRIESRSFDKPGFSVGTGFLISPFHVLTCAHNIYPVKAPKTKSITVFASEGSKPTASAIASNGWAISPAWRPNDCATMGEDYGIIRLSRPVSGQFLRLRNFDPARLSGAQARLAGFPTTTADPMALAMFEATGPIDGAVQIVACGRDATGFETFNGRILPTVSQATPMFAHSIGSNHGVSGAPIWINDGDDLTVVGIHDRNIGNGSFGAAILLNDRVRQNVAHWLATALPALAQSAQGNMQVSPARLAEVTPEQTDTAKNCAGWISDKTSFCKRVADQYMQSEYPNLKRGAIRTWHSTNNILNMVYYPNDIAVGVSFFSMPNFVIVRRHFHPTGPRCEYDFNCLPSGEIIFTKRSCRSS